MVWSNSGSTVLLVFHKVQDCIFFRQLRAGAQEKPDFTNLLPVHVVNASMQFLPYTIQSLGLSLHTLKFVCV